MNSPATLRCCPDLLHYARRTTREVMVGNVGVGGDNPIRVQSMITSDTRDTPACVAEVLGLAEAGCEIVRITAQTKIYAANLENIAREVRAAGCQVPLVADIHFKPDAAMEAAKWVEKVRVNPGNFVDKKKFEIREYSDAQYAEELERIRAEFTPLVHRCKDLGRAMRIGTNHGSLSDRIMNRYGDTPLGMCESALEFARIARENDYHNFVFSMKASNPKVMIEAYRLLVARLDAEGADWNYPIHLGVTEAGDGEDGRIKSAIGIGSLLADGIGDTIRVSLTEDAIHEIPVAQALADIYNERSNVDGGLGVSPQTVAGASRPNLNLEAQAIRPDWEQLTKNTSTYLPHWRIPGATYSVTFRLIDSMPPSALEDFRMRKENLEKRLQDLVSQSGSRNSTTALVTVRSEIAALHETALDSALNEGHGECLLRRMEIAEMVLGALKFFDGSRYILHAWSVMPNHVHAILCPLENHGLEKIIHSWKSFTAKKANEILQRAGTFWQEEYYDHVVRDGEDFKNQVRYVLENPRKGNAFGGWTGSRYGDSWEDVLGARRPGNGLERDAPATFAPAALGEEALVASYDPFSYEKRASSVLTIMSHELGGDRTVRVFTTQERWNALAHKISGMGDFKPEIIFEKSGVVEIDPRDETAVAFLNSSPETKLITVADGLDLEVIHAFRELAFRVEPRHPILLKDTLHPPQGETDFLTALLPAAQNIGSLLSDGIGDAILVRGETAPGQSLRLAYNILQAAGTRIFKTDYVACPSCGRTLFNLQHTTQKIRAATGHLKGVRIAVMGCIVNGPGEMADADFGYVGGAPNKINLYVGKIAVKFNIPEAEAVERLTDLIREHGKWVDAPLPTTAEV
ncbi:MAG: (E)-4-hydroxy-3-methylbut-2-enyl-diphosphate synthase [Akkermansiaceae bacterium]